MSKSVIKETLHWSSHSERYFWIFLFLSLLSPQARTKLFEDITQTNFHLPLKRIINISPLQITFLTTWALWAFTIHGRGTQQRTLVAKIQIQMLTYIIHSPFLKHSLFFRLCASTFKLAYCLCGYNQFWHMRAETPSKSKSRGFEEKLWHLHFLIHSI